MVSKRIDFEHMPAIYWSDKTKISYLQRRVLVYSIMYYQYNESCVTDMFYDQISEQLVELQHSNPKAFKQSEYYYAMYDFDGTTGFDIPNRLSKADKNKLSTIANQVRASWVSNGKVVVL